MCETLLAETGVALLPGVDFGHQPEELLARLAYVDFDGQKVMEAVEKHYTDKKLNENFIREYCPNIWDGIQRIIDWLEKL